MKMIRTLLLAVATMAVASSHSAAAGQAEVPKKGVVTNVAFDAEDFPPEDQLTFEDVSLLGLQRSATLVRSAPKKPSAPKKEESLDSASLLGLQRSVKLFRGPAVEEKEE
eukprot:gb/GFBE01035141.1/.p1 GENE.gb/GFBE01035141.1/~~gb/GFBE01035141.1/.p1  ORF type:complete len:110 (+),score=27.32 gb/GFBE01035141.1/:1-330(+)